MLHFTENVLFFISPSRSECRKEQEPNMRGVVLHLRGTESVLLAVLTFIFPLLNTHRGVKIHMS